MKAVYTQAHAKHAPAKEFSMGEMQPCFEKPDRAFFVQKALSDRGGFTFIEPKNNDFSVTYGVHDRAYVDFLKTAHAEWKATGYETDAFGSAFNVQHPESRPPLDIDGKLGYYMADGTVPLTATSWDAIESSVQTALTAQALLAEGESSAFALCRPPGHHATTRVAAGYCFLNNAAIAAQAFLNQGAKRIALLDVDYHHGNGTQEIFYDRDDVLFLSIHADPAMDYPYFLGYADETGRGKGEGFNVNYPLDFGTDFNAYTEALNDAMAKITDYAPDAFIVSLGVDTFKDDPISKFVLNSEDYFKIGAACAGLSKSTLFVMEGGYAVEEIGINVANTLEGFLNA